MDVARFQFVFQYEAALSIVIKGKVQGVYYRASAKHKAEELGITGFAQNLSDGSVLIEAEGEARYLKEFMEWCKIGPKHAKVSDVISTDGSLAGHQKFEIRR